MALSSNALAFKLAFAVSPIVLTGGIAGGMLGGALPIGMLTDAISFIGGALSGEPLSEDDFFALFQPLPGSTLLDQQIGEFPFANQAVAANATIQQPLVVSMLMVCAAGLSGGYYTKLATLTAFQASLQQHIQMGGMFTILTPGFVYANCVLLNMTDFSNSISKQVQNAYKLDFSLPLVTLAQAQQAQNSLMQSITNGVQPSATPGVGSGQAPTVSPSFAGSTAGGAGGVTPTPSAGPIQGPQI